MSGISKKAPKEAYDAGFNCGSNGKNTEDSHFSIFSSEENIIARKHDNRDGKAKLKPGKKLRTLYIFSK